MLARIRQILADVLDTRREQTVLANDIRDLVVIVSEGASHAVAERLGGAAQQMAVTLMFHGILATSKSIVGKLIQPEQTASRAKAVADLRAAIALLEAESLPPKAKPVASATLPRDRGLEID